MQHPGSDRRDDSSELAIVSARRGRLLAMQRAGSPGASAALALAEDPQRFLPTVQIGISLVGILAGVFGGAQLAGPLGEAIARAQQRIIVLERQTR